MRLEMLEEGSANGPGWVGRALLRVVKTITGFRPGPVIVILLRPRLLPSELKTYMTRGLTGKGVWTKGEAELFAAFASKLNSCHF